MAEEKRGEKREKIAGRKAENAGKAEKPGKAPATTKGASRNPPRQIFSRKISFEMYAIAFLLSAVLFFAGVLAGQAIDGSTMSKMSADVQKLTSRLESLQLLILLDENATSFCSVYDSELRALDGEVEKTGYELTFMENEKKIFDNELKKRYFVLETESMLLSKKIGEKCWQNATILIYFYSNKECEECILQGDTILEARNEFKGGNIKIYSYDGTIGSPVADALKRQYGITAYPSMVVDGTTYAGFRSREEVLGIFREATENDMPAD